MSSDCDSSDDNEDDQYHHQQEQQENRHYSSNVNEGDSNGNCDENENEALSLLDVRRLKMMFRFNPEELPRPSRRDEIFKGRNGNNTYTTNINEWIYHPPINSSYTVIETENSSINFIRPSFHVISQSRAFFDNTKLKYGFCIDPFQSDPNIQSIPIDSIDKIVSCIQCNTYYTKQCIATQYPTGPVEEALKYTCNVCGYANYFSSMKHYFPKFNHVSIDYAMPLNDDAIVKECELYAIDVSVNAIQSNFALYVIEMIRNSLNSMENYKRKVGFMTFDEKQLCFYYYDINTIRMICVNDMKNPFIPLPSDVLFEDSKRYENILEVIIRNIDQKRQSIHSTKNNNSYSSSIDSVIIAGNGYDESYLHLYLFTNSKSMIDNNNFKSPTFISSSLNHKESNHRISYDIFIVSHNENQSLALHNYTSHNIKSHYYTINPKNPTDSILYDKMYYDLYHLMDSPRYYDISFKMLTSKRFKPNIITPCFNTNDNQRLNSSGNNLMVSYEIAYNIKKLPDDKSHAFQWFMDYISPKDNCRHLRIFSYQTNTTDNFSSLFSSIDIDSLIPLTVNNEIRQLISSKKSLKDSIAIMNKNIDTILIDSLNEYKSEVYLGSTIDSLSIPLTLSNFPLYLYSFTHLKPLRLSALHPMPLYFNSIYNSILSLTNSPLNKVTRILYPKLIRIDSEKITYVPLSLFFIRMNMALLHDNGDIVTLFLMKRLPTNIFHELTQGCNSTNSNETIKDAIVNKIDQYNQHHPHVSSDNTTLSHRLLSKLTKYNNQVFNVRVITDEESISNDFLMLLNEDSIFIGDNSYEDFIFSINQRICEKYLGSF